MKMPVYRQRGSLEFNMTPMIDVTFLLIIFFLVSSNMAQQENAVDLNLPTAESGRDPQDDAMRRVTVSLTADGTLLLAGEAMDPAELGRRLAFERTKPEPLEVRIRCDRTVEYGRVKPVMRECLKHNVDKVAFAVVKAE